MRVYGVAICKGGQGKSTTVSTVARLAAIAGARVLVIDLAQPGTTSASLRDIWPENECGTLSSLLHAFRTVPPGQVPSSADVNDTLQRAALPVRLQSQPSWDQGFVAVLPWDELLGDAAAFLHSERVLAGIVQALSSAFDIAVIDFPGDGGPLLTTAIAASERIILPLAAETPALEGADALLRLMARAREAGHNITLAGILLTRCDPRNKRVSDVIQAILQSPEVEGEPLASRLLPFGIRANEFFEQAFRFGNPVWERTGNPSDWAGYVFLAEWLLRDAGLSTLAQNRRGPALLQSETRIFDTTALRLGDADILLEEFEAKHNLVARR